MKALVTGITGQDGSYIAELLLEKGYEVHGLVRRASTHNTHERIRHIKDDLILHTGDLSDASGMISLVKEIEPDEVYNLGAQSHVGESFTQPLYTSMVDASGVLHLLEGIRQFSPNSKFYQASTSELFGRVQETPQVETTPMYPRSPYGVAKLYGYWITKNYRESYNTFACNGILFNHESSRRGAEFVTRKITLGIRDIVMNKSTEPISVGNIYSKRDWGHARDYVNGMWLMLQQNKPDDYILATGETHTVKEFITKAFAFAGIVVSWSGSGIDEYAVDQHNGQVVVRIDKNFFRPAEVDLLLGNPSKAEAELGWKRSVSFDDLVKDMVYHDLT